MAYLNRGYVNIKMKSFVALGVLSLLTCVADAGVSMDNPFFCYLTDPIRTMTHTAASINSYEPTLRFSFATVNPHISTCTPSRFWYLGRYAARFPNVPFMQPMINFAESSVRSDIVRNYEAGRTTLCRPDFEAIRDFSLDTEFENQLIIENELMVMESGVIAMKNIARRFQQTFPDILTQNYSPDRFHFRHTGEEWSNVTIRAFASGLFGEAESQNVIYGDVPAVDWLLRPLNFCPAFSAEIADWTASRNAFREGPEIQEMIQQINRRLGFHTSNQLSFDQIYAMWDLCRFKMAFSFETSNSETGGNATWCAPFSVAHHLLLEYYVDVGHFDRDSYGVRNQRMLENLGCGMIQDLLTHMQSDNNADQMTRIFTTNGRSTLIMLTALGTFKDLWPLHQHNFAQQSDRYFLSSLLVSFSSNLVVVRYDCDDGEHDLMFLFNERQILVPGCDQQTGLCKLSVIVNRFQRFINANCEASFCSND